MNKAEFFEAVKQLESHRRIDPQDIYRAVEEALVAAYKKKFGEEREVRVVIDPEKRDIQIIEVVETDKGKEERTSSVDLIGWLGAQRAKELLLQKIRDAEREKICREYRERRGELVTGTVKQEHSGYVFLDLGDAEAILPPEERIPGETYKRNQRLRAVVLDVNEKARSEPPVRVSRTHPMLVRRLFELEVPEIAEGIVKIVAVAREPGYRTKIAVASEDKNVDPTGACVGPKGQRVKMVVKELNREKIDVVAWDEDPARFVANALSPARIKKVIVDPATETAYVVVPEDQLSLAIGKEGQNARLAARLTGLRIDIKSEAEAEEVERQAEEIREKDAELEELLRKALGGMEEEEE